MTRIFQRGELRHAVLAALAGIEPANGYTIMQALSEAIGGSWRASPGAIYPAILSLEDAGLIEGSDDEGGSRTYRLTAHGHLLHLEVTGTLAAVADRARNAEPSHTLGSLLDTFASNLDPRSQRLDATTARAITQVLDRATAQVERILNRENQTHG